MGKEPKGAMFPKHMPGATSGPSRACHLPVSGFLPEVAVDRTKFPRLRSLHLKQEQAMLRWLGCEG